MGSKTSGRILARLILAGLMPEWEYSLRMKARQKAKSFLVPALDLPSPGDTFGRVSRFTDLYLESVKTVGIPHLCHYDDRSTMAKSIEGRMPFLDHRLLEFVSRLRPDAFYESGYTKVIFRKAFADLLPVEIVERKDKVGFYTPIGNLILKSKPWVLSLLNESSTLQWVDSLRLDQLRYRVSKEMLDERTATLIFRIVSLVLWNRSCQFNNS